MAFPVADPPDGHRVFDRALVRRRRDRAAPGFTAFDFLIREAADRMADRLCDIRRNFPVAAELGAHTGLNRQALTASGKIGWLGQADLSPRQIALGAGPRLAADEEFLPFAGESLDLVLSVLSLHWVNDLPGALIQINRALKPDGLFMAVLFGTGSLVELRESLAAAEMELDGGLSPRVSPFLDVRDGGGLLQRARFALPVAEVDRIEVTYETPFGLLKDLRGMGETNAVRERRRTPLARRTLMRAMEIYRDRYQRPDGRVPASFELIWLTGWAPHESQQKPLAPGSARMRLADALGTAEITAGEKAQPKG